MAQERDSVATLDRVRRMRLGYALVDREPDAEPGDRLEQVRRGDDALERAVLVDHEGHVDRRGPQRLERVRLVVDGGDRADQGREAERAALALLRHGGSRRPAGGDDRELDYGEEAVKDDQEGDGGELQGQGSRMKGCDPVHGPVLKKPLPAKPRSFQSMLKLTEPISAWD
jgi:hypothetical protein